MIQAESTGSWCTRGVHRLSVPVGEVDWTRGYLTLMVRSGIEERTDAWVYEGAYYHFLEWDASVCPADIRGAPTLSLAVLAN